MAKQFFLRFTETPEADLERGTSVHTLNPVDICSREEQAEQVGVEPEEVVNVNGSWAQVLNGLCGYEVDDLEDGIETGQNGVGVLSGAFAIFSGEETENDCPDGTQFTPYEIIYKQ